MSDGGTDGTDNALTGVMTDITDEEQTDGDLPGFHAGNFPCFSPIITGELQWVFS